MKEVRNISLQDVLLLIERFISPVWTPICIGDDFIKTWDHNRLEWIRRLNY